MVDGQRIFVVWRKILHTCTPQLCYINNCVESSGYKHLHSWGNDGCLLVNPLFMRVLRWSSVAIYPPIMLMAAPLILYPIYLPVYSRLFLLWLLVNISPILIPLFMRDSTASTPTITAGFQLCFAVEISPYNHMFTYPHIFLLSSFTYYSIMIRYLLYG